MKKLFCILIPLIGSFCSVAQASSPPYRHPKITIDGIFTDWRKTIPFSKDYDDQSNNGIDIEEVSLANDPEKLYFKFDVHGTITRSGHVYIIYLDTDENIYTGFNGTEQAAWNIGADYRIYMDEWNVGLQEFIRTDENTGLDIWGWENMEYALQSIDSAFDKGSWEGSIAREDIKETADCEKTRFLFRAYENAPPYTNDFLPDPAWARTMLYPYRNNHYSCCSTADMTLDIDNYLVYYGSEASPEKLSAYDLVILQQGAYDKTAVEQIQATGTVVLVYISLGEECRRENNNAPCIPPEATGGNGPSYYDKESGTIKYKGNNYAPYYMDEDNDGKPDQNGTWGTSFINPGDPAWKALIKEQIDELINDAGYDGFFLDTIGTAETATYGWTAQGMVDLIAAMRQHLDETYGYGKKYMVANAAVSLFDHYQPYVNGVMLESFSSRWNKDKFDNIIYTPWDEINLYNNNRLARLLNTLRCYPHNTSVNVFTLDYCAEGDAACAGESICRARSFGLIPGITNMYLDKIYDTISVPRCSPAHSLIMNGLKFNGQQLPKRPNVVCGPGLPSPKFEEAVSYESLPYTPLILR